MDTANDDPLKTMLDSLNRRLAESIGTLNAAPEPQMGGLSPDQVARLIYSEWGAANGVVQISTDTSLADLKGSTTFRVARTLLKAVHEAGGVRPTAAKNLPRRLVAELLPSLYDEEQLAVLREWRKNVNEQDVWSLHIARVVAQGAGLIRQYKGKLVVPKSKAPLLRDDCAGDLFGILFTTFFRKLNLAYVHQCGPEAHSLQQCVGYTLLRLGSVAREWCRVEDLPAQVVLPAVRAEVEDEIDEYFFWTVDKVLSGRVITPLIHWGLLEGRHDEEEHIRLLKEVRVTALYDSVLQFRLD